MAFLAHDFFLQMRMQNSEQLRIDRLTSYEFLKVFEMFLRNELSMTIGVTPIQFAQSVDDKGELTGTQAPSFKFWFEHGIGANVTYVETPIKGNEVGKCYANGTCSGHIGQLWLKNQDIELVCEAIGILDFVTTPPVIFSPVAITWITRIVSVPEPPSNIERTGDVIDSFNIESILMTTIGFLFICCLLVTFKNIYREAERKRPKNIIWTVLRAFLFQSNFIYEKSSFRLISISLLSGLLVCKAFYDGNFKTDLTIKEKQVTIETLADLLNTDRWPGFFHGDTALKFFETSRNELERKVVAITKARYKAGKFSIASLSAGAMTDLITSIRNRSAVLIGPQPVEFYMRLIDCYLQIQSEKFYDIQLYVGSGHYNDEINSFIYNPNISKVLRARLDKRIMRLFEMHFFYKAGVIDVFEVAARGMAVEWNWKNSRCVQPDWKNDKHHLVIPLRFVNIKKLLKILACHLIFAFFVTLGERIRFWSRPTRRRVKRLRKQMSRTAPQVLTRRIVLNVQSPDEIRTWLRDRRIRMLRQRQC